MSRCARSSRPSAICSPARSTRSPALPGLQLDERDYFRDVYDHLIRISDLIDSYRDLLSGATDLYLSTIGNRQNEVMQQLTVIATVFLPLSFITGFFGMNFGFMVNHLITAGVDVLGHRAREHARHLRRAAGLLSPPGMDVSAPVVVIHAGAGGRGGAARRSPRRCRAALGESLTAARAALRRGGDALAAVQAAVIVMEDFELFNAGRGAVLCSDGSVECSAAVMRSDRRAGAVALVGAHATRSAPRGRFWAVTKFSSRARPPTRRRGPVDDGDLHHRTPAAAAGRPAAGGRRSTRTVGAVCLDANGVLAAGTSTGRHPGPAAGPGR